MTFGLDVMHVNLVGNLLGIVDASLQSTVCDLRNVYSGWKWLFALFRAKLRALNFTRILDFFYSFLVLSLCLFLSRDGNSRACFLTGTITLYRNISNKLNKFQFFIGNTSAWRNIIMIIEINTCAYDMLFHFVYKHTVSTKILVRIEFR